MGPDSSLCAKLCERSVSQFKDNVSQHKIANNLGLSPSTVHNFVKGFGESKEISVRKGQVQKPLLNARVHRALRRYCLRNRHATMMEITLHYILFGRRFYYDIATWAQEYSGKSLSLNTVHRSIKKSNFQFLCRNAAEFSGPEVI